MTEEVSMPTVDKTLAALQEMQETRVAWARRTRRIYIAWFGTLAVLLFAAGMAVDHKFNELQRRLDNQRLTNSELALM